MRAFVITELSGPEAGAITEIPAPEGAHPWTEGQRLLIEVHAAGISFPDLLQTRGMYQHAQPVPYVAGGEVAGVVREAPAGSPFVPGDRVAGLTVFGALAEYALGLPDYTIKLPSDVDFGAGAALYLNYATAWFSLYRAGFVAHDVVLVHGASGGVGTATLQLVRARGGVPVAVVSSEAKAQAAREAGAEDVLLSSGPWAQQVKELTGGQGAQVVVDPVGGDRVTDSLRSLDVGGRLAVVGFAAGEIPEVKLNRLLLRDLSVVGVALEPYARRYPDVLRMLTTELENMAARGQIHPLVGHRLPMEQAAEALSLIDRREAVGKVVVDVRDDSGEDRAVTV